MRCKILKRIFLIYFFSCQIFLAFSQNEIDSLFNKRSEIYFKFNISSRSEINSLTRMISIDNVKGNQVFAYANKKDFFNFLQLNYSYSILNTPSSLINPKMFDKNEKGNYNWNAYPTYQAYESMMYQFAADYPTLCKLDTIGILASGRKLLAVKISNNVNKIENEPQFLYTSSIHGDEVTGYVLMLRLIDDLLSNYGKDSLITYLVNHVAIWINPLANPDGTYNAGNSTVSGATRFNANTVDLNRNYPDPADGPHSDGYQWQPETMAFMNFASKHNFVMSINFHGGSEVVNYPWDTYSQLHADNDWWIHVSKMYADTAQKYSSFNGYLSDIISAIPGIPGITDGYSWYSVSGGRQDYMNYFHHCREATIELSYDKTPVASMLSSYWDYNYHSFLNYIQQCVYGIRGNVQDSITHAPLKALITIDNHDKDSSQVYSSLPLGFFSRPIFQGTYNITFSSPGYVSKTLKNIIVKNNSTLNLDTILLAKDTTNSIAYLNSSNLDINIFPNPSHGHFTIQIPASDQNIFFKITNQTGQLIFYSDKIKENQYSLDLTSYPKGIYYLIFSNNKNIKTVKLASY